MLSVYQRSGYGTDGYCPWQRGTGGVGTGLGICEEKLVLMNEYKGHMECDGSVLHSVMSFFCGIEAGMDLAVVHVVQWAHKILYQ